MAQQRRNGAVIFDADGTLLDSKGWLVGAAEYTLTQYGCGMSAQDIMADLLAGTPLKDFYQKHIPHADVEECIKTHQQYQETTTDLTGLFAEVLETLNVLRAESFGLAIVTSRKSRAPLLQTMGTLKLDRFFEVVVCLEDVTHAKPHPESVFLAMKMLGVEPCDTFFVGDTFPDMEAGRRAGVTTIGALYGFEGENLKAAKADEYIKRFSQVLDIVLTD